METSVALSGVVTENPELGLEIGTTLHFEGKRFMMSAEVAHESIVNADAFDGAVLAVAFPTPSYNNVLGSAIMVAPGIAITAAHVMDECMDEVMSGRFGAMCLGLDMDRLDIWRIKHVTLGPSGRSDLAVLSLELSSRLPDDLAFSFASISTRTPAVGERLKVLGFRQTDDPEAPSAVRNMAVRLFLSTGTVTQHFPHGRGRDLGPCVEIDCHTTGGMSGGPVFDEQGMLLGILSKGLDGGPSWMSLIWPALICSVTNGWPLAVMAGARALLDLDPRMISIDGRDALRSVATEAEGIGRVEYVPWS